MSLHNLPRVLFLVENEYDLVQILLVHYAHVLASNPKEGNSRNLEKKEKSNSSKIWHLTNCMDSLVIHLSISRT